jgi:glycosyltransferase involved in cell wall biosynthesis
MSDANQASDKYLPPRNAPRVCAVVVTYNRPALLRECLLALQEQTRTVDEILVVDNASTDDTRAMLKTSSRRCKYLRCARTAAARAASTPG